MFDIPNERTFDGTKDWKVCQARRVSSRVSKGECKTRQSMYGSLSDEKVKLESEVDIEVLICLGMGSEGLYGILLGSWPEGAVNLVWILKDVS